MKRLVYAPYVQAFVKTDDGVIDVSPYIVRGSVNRKVNQVSSAQLTLRNPVLGDTSNLLFTEYVSAQTPEPHPLIHPMDPIIIIMQRLQSHPVQVFTGYVDTAPYFQLYPGLCTIEASCTLKRLLYTQWDAALPAVQDFLGQFGWIPTGNGIWNPGTEAKNLAPLAGQLQGQFNDGSIGALLFAVLNIIGNWDESIIWIEALPPQIKPLVTQLYKRIEPLVAQGEAQFQSLITQILGATSQGNGNLGGSAAVGATADVAIAVPAMIQAANNNGVPPLFILAVSYNETSWSASEVGVSKDANSGYDVGWFQVNYPSSPSANSTAQPYGSTPITPAQAEDPGFIADLFAKYCKSKGGPPSDPSQWEAFATRVQVSIGYPNWDSNMPTVQQYYNKYKNTPVSSSSGNMKGAANASTAPNNASSAADSTASTSQSGRSPGGKQGNSSPGAKSSALGNIFPYNTKGIFVERTDAGVDFQVPDGVSVGAIGDGKIGKPIPNWYQSDWLIQVILDTPIDGFPAWYISEGIKPDPIAFQVGAPVKAGQQIAVTQSTGHGIETGWSNGTQQAAAGDSVTSEGSDFANYIGVPISANQHIPLDWSKLTPGQNTGVGGGGGATTGTGTSTTAAAFATMINLPSIFQQAEAVVFTGKRSFIADQPLFPFIDQLCKASLRSFMSMPNGNFFAFFPDYFGLFGRKYYWEIRDIEILDGRIDLSDDPLLTNVAVAGDVTQYHGTVDTTDLLLTSGIFDIFDAFASGYIGTFRDIGALLDTEKYKPAVGKSAALSFLQRYGARPYVEEVPAIRSPFFELFLAFQNFMIAWSKQFQTTFELTFMPELFPGGLIALPDHHIQCYLEEVVHDFDYEQGFTTTVSLSSPSVFDNHSRKNISQGMARPAALTATPGTANRHKAAK